MFRQSFVRSLNTSFWKGEFLCIRKKRASACRSNHSRRPVIVSSQKDSPLHPSVSPSRADLSRQPETIICRVPSISPSRIGRCISTRTQLPADLGNALRIDIPAARFLGGWRFGKTQGLRFCFRSIAKSSHRAEWAVAHWPIFKTEN